MSIMEQPKIKSVMTPFPYSIHSSQTIAQARDLMAEHNIRHLPVIDAHRLVGIVSDRDITLAFSLSAHIMDSADVLIGDICNKNVFTAQIDDDLGPVAAQMAEEHIGSVVVMKEDRVAGIFTTTDACRYLGSLFGGGDGPKSDARRLASGSV